jgi:hypothetical protein
MPQQHPELPGEVLGENRRVIDKDISHQERYEHDTYRHEAKIGRLSIQLFG